MAEVVGAVEALTGPQRFVQELVAEYQRRRDFIHPALAAVPGLSCVPPAGAFYAFPNVARYLSPRVPDTLGLSLRLLEQAQVAVVPGEGFGAPGYVRVSFARPMEELQDGLRRMSGFLAGLRGD